MRWDEMSEEQRYYGVKAKVIQRCTRHEIAKEFNTTQGVISGFMARNKLSVTDLLGRKAAIEQRTMRAIHTGDVGKFWEKDGSLLRENIARKAAEGARKQREALEANK